jgi:hypothetical protein
MRNNHYQQYQLFNEDIKKFYCQINNQKADVQELHTRQQIEHFWHGILEDAVNHNDKTTWIKLEKKYHEHLTPDPWIRLHGQ